MALLLGAAMVLAEAAAPPDPSDTSLSTIQRVDALIDRVKYAHRGFETLQAGFEQLTTSELLLEPEEAVGRFYYEEPDKVRWEYFEPTPKVVLVRGDELTTWYKDLDLAERIEISDQSNQVFKYLGASGSLDALREYFEFRVRFPEVASGNYELTLIPRYRRISKRLARMDLIIDGETFFPRKLAYVEAGGDTIEYRFNSLRINESLGEGRFDLDLPADVEIRVIAVH